MKKVETDILKETMALINDQHIMTLASSENNSPWATPVYYLFHNSDFYFFSKPSSRHIETSMKTNKAAASIHFQSSGWADIRGIQMEGVITASGVDKDSALAFKAYINKFSFISEIKNNASSIKDIPSVESAFQARLFKFSPTRVFYLDNSIEFGFKEIIDL